MEQVKSLQTITRSATYLRHLKTILAQGKAEDTIQAMATATGTDTRTVESDLTAIVGSADNTFAISTMIASIEHYLGYDDTCSAVLAGVGGLGSAILGYQGFSDYGIDVVAAFDNDKKVIGSIVAGKKIMDITQMYELCGRMKVLIGIVSVPAKVAQGVCDNMVAAGIKAIWNFAPVQLKVPKGVLVQNENIADSLLTLSGRVEQELKSNPDFADATTEFDTINGIMNKYGRDPKKIDLVVREAQDSGVSAAGMHYIQEVLGK